MGDQEIGARSRRGMPLDQPRERDGGGVGGLIEPGRRTASSRAIQRLLDVEPLDHRLDDPVAVGEQRPDRPRCCRSDQPRRGLRHEGRRVGLQQRAQRLRRCAAVAGASATMSSSSTGTPALATWAAMPAPITPAPMTPTLRCASHRAPARWRCPGRRRCTASPARTGRPRAAAARRLAGDARAGRAERMAERDRAAVEVHGLVRCRARACRRAPGWRRPRSARPRRDRCDGDARPAPAPCARPRPGRCP